jgi:hypothetical protein
LLAKRSKRPKEENPTDRPHRVFFKPNTFHGYVNGRSMGGLDACRFYIFVHHGW